MVSKYLLRITPNAPGASQTRMINNDRQKGLPLLVWLVRQVHDASQEWLTILDWLVHQDLGPNTK